MITGGQVNNFGSASRVVVNGKEVGAFRSVSIDDDGITVDGVRQPSEGKQWTIQITGDVGSVAGTAKSVTVTGNVTGDVRATNGVVNISGNVHGDARATNGSVHAKEVKGKVSATNGSVYTGSRARVHEAGSTAE